MTEIPDRAEIVVVGGGVIGCSTAYHLAKAGRRDVVLLERAKLTSGTTWHSAAMVRALRSTASLTTLARYSARLYQELEAETGQSTGWIGCGSLSIATNPDRLEHIRRQASLARAFGIPVAEIGRDEIARLWPIMRTDDVLAGIHSPADGRVTASDLCAALMKGARAGGVRVFEDTPVTGFDIRGGRIAGVRVGGRTIACETAVLCAGLWSRALARAAGVAAPLQACHHLALITRPFEGITPGMPILGDHDGRMYIRDEGGGLMVGCFEPNARPIDPAELPADFAFGLLPEDWDQFEPIVAGAVNRIPALATAETRMLLNGPESFTLDNAFLLGEAPELDGLFLCCGMNSVGVASGGGAGRALAEWIVAGAPTMDLAGVDIRRVPAVRDTLRVLRARAPEVLSTHYALHRPGFELAAGRPARLSPLHERLAARGARFGERAGWERALFFDPSGDTPYEPSFGRAPWHDRVRAEHIAAREAVAVFDQTAFGKILVQGRDAAAALERLCAARIDVAPGRAVYTPVLNDRGGCESDWVVLRLDDARFLIVTGSAQPRRDMHILKRGLGDAHAIATDVTGAWAVLTVTGPRSRALLAELTPDSMAAADFPLYTHREIEIGATIARAVRLSYAGELGWELHVPVETALPLYDLLCAAGAPHGLRDAGILALNGLRLEKGFCAWGTDIGPDDTPLEAGTGAGIKLRSDVPFVGREALERQRDAGPARRRVLLRAADPALMLIGGEPIVVDGTIRGHVTSAAMGWTVGAAVAMGTVRLDGDDPAALVAGATFEVEVALTRHPVRASLRAFHDPAGTRMRDGR